MGFIDGHHDQEATIQYFEKIIPFLGANSILIFDDINWSEGMFQAWQKIKSNSYVSMSFDFYKLGVVICNSSASFEKKHYKISFL